MGKSKYRIEDLYALKIKAFWQVFKTESWSFKLVAFFLFLEYVRPQSIYPIIDIIPWSQITILMALALLIIKPEKYNISVKPFQLSRAARKEYYITPLFGVFVLHAMLTIVFSDSPEWALERVDVLLSWLIIYFLIISIVNKEQRWVFLLALFFLCNFKMSFHGFRVWVGRGFSFASYGVSGPSGWFRNSGEFGMQMLYIFPLLVATIYAIRPYISSTMFKLVHFIPVTAASSVIASSSRGDLLGLVVTILLFLIKRGLSIRVVILGGILFSLLYFVTPDRFKERFESAGTDTTSVTRLEYWANGVEIANQHPIFGVGYENWVPYYYNHYFNPEIYRRVETAHNTFIQCMAELGYVGLGLFLLLCYTSYKLNVATEKIGRQADSKFYIYLPIAFNIALISLMVSSSFIAALYYPFYWIHFAFTVALHRAAKDNATKVLHMQAAAEPETDLKPLPAS